MGPGGASLWSASPVVWRKLERLGIAPTQETRFPGGPVTGRTYAIPLSRFRWGLKRVGGAAPGSRVGFGTTVKRAVSGASASDPVSLPIGAGLPGLTPLSRASLAEVGP